MRKSLLKLSDLTKGEIIKILDLADQLKFEQKSGIEHHTLKGKTLAMIFAKPSPRTRISFEVGMFQLGGHALCLGMNDLQLGQGGTIEDTISAIYPMTDGIMIRAFSQKDVEYLAKNSAIPIINGLSDFAHPCQVLADLMTIRERLNELEGKKIAFLGSGSVCNSMIAGAKICDMTITVAAPEQYKPDKEAAEFAGCAYKFTTNPKEAVKSADVIVTDVWASTEQGPDILARKEAFAPFQVNVELMKYAPSHAIVQHCLPSRKGEEITEDVFKKHANAIYTEVENRLHVQKAIMTIFMR